MAVDLVTQIVTDPDDAALTFQIDPDQKQAMLSGRDAIAATLDHADAIRQFQILHRLRRPWIWPDS